MTEETKAKFDPTESFQTLDATLLASIIGNASEARDARNAKSGGGYIPSGYPQAGTSKIRVFLDPAQKLYRPVKTFKITDPYKRVMDPRFFKDKIDPTGAAIPDELVEQIWDLSDGLDYNNAPGAGARYEVLCYVLLISTESPDDKYWKPGTLYQAHFNSRFEEALLTQLANLTANPNTAAEMAKSLNPLSEGWAFDMVMVKGAQGSCTLTPTYGTNFDGVEIDEKYKPLDEVYVSTNFVPEDAILIPEMLKQARIDANLDIEESDSDIPPPPPTPGANQAADASAAQAGASDDQAAANKVAAESAAKLVTAGAASAPDKVPEGDGAPWEEGKEGVPTDATFGLNDDQQAAATAAGMSLEEFAKMIGLA